MRRSIEIKGKSWPMRFPLSAQEEVLKALDMKSFADFANEEKATEVASSPRVLGEVAYIGCTYAAKQDGVDFPYTKEAFFDNVTSAMQSFEQLLADIGMTANAEGDGKKK